MPFPRLPARPASSNMSISRAPTASSAAARSTRSASSMGGELATRGAGRRRRRRPGARFGRAGGARLCAGSPAFPSSSASSATTMSGAPSSSRRSRSGRSASSSSTMPTAPSIAGKRVVLVDDSIVRGTTSVKIVQMMYEAGAGEVHMRIAEPADHPSRFLRHRHAGAANSCSPPRMTLEEMRAFIGVDIARLPLGRRPLPRGRRCPAAIRVRPQFTDHCFTGDYPTPLTDQAATAAGQLRCSPRPS